MLWIIVSTVTVKCMDSTSGLDACYVEAMVNGDYVC